MSDTPLISATSCIIRRLCVLLHTTKAPCSMPSTPSAKSCCPSRWSSPWAISCAAPDRFRNHVGLLYINNRLKQQNIFRLKEIRRASANRSYPLENNLTASEKIVALCREVHATEYYCGGTGFAAYLDQGIFEKYGISVTIQDWRCQEYPQLFTKQQGFIPNLSIIDLLMNVSSDHAFAIVKE